MGILLQALFQRAPSTIEHRAPNTNAVRSCRQEAEATYLFAPPLQSFCAKGISPIPPLLDGFVTLVQRLYSRVKKMRKAKPPAEMMVIDSQEEDTHNNWCVHLSVV